MGSDPSQAMIVGDVNTSSLDRLIGYNSKRVSFAVMNAVTSKIQAFGLQSPIDYSVLNIIGHNPGITSRQLCNALAIYPPNVVGIVKGFEERNLLERRIHPSDRRAQGLYLTDDGMVLHSRAEAVVVEVDIAVTHTLSRPERDQLNALLRKIYASESLCQDVK
jgi:DNA-binding MarR family transcriptional regulator